MATNQVNPASKMQHPGFPAYVQQILTERFGEGVNVSREAGEQRVSGYIVSDRFTDLEPLERQREMRDYLKQRLDADVQGVSIILAYSPHEWTVMHED